MLARRGLGPFGETKEGGRLAGLIATKDSLVRLGAACIEARSPGSGLGCLLAAVDMDPEWPESRYQLIAEYLREGNVNDAEPHAAKLIALEPQRARGHTSMALISVARGKSEDALVELNRALACEPQDFTTQFGLGSVLSTQGKWDEALAHFQEALRIQPGSIDAKNSVETLQKRIAARAPTNTSAGP